MLKITIATVVSCAVLQAPVAATQRGAEDAVRTFQRQLAAAEAGNGIAQNEVGVRYAEGRGVGQDIPRGMYWFEKSVESGEARAACNLGLHFARGWGVSKDVVTSLKWYIIGDSLDALSCSLTEEEVLQVFGVKPTYAQFYQAGLRAVAWADAHPKTFPNHRDHRQ